MAEFWVIFGVFCGIDEFRNGLLHLGAQISEAQVDDLIMILDKDGDGEIDYSEFARWFGRGAPPPPMLPQARAAAAAQVRILLLAACCLYIHASD